MTIQRKTKKILSIICLFLLFFTVGCEKFQITDMEDGALEDTIESTEEDEDITSNSTGVSTLRYAIVNEPANIDPQTMNSSVSATLGFHVYEGLVKNNRGTVKNAMARSYEISNDALTYTFHLREANWSDGQPVTAQHFVNGIKRLANPSTNSDYAYLVSYIKGGKAVMEGKGELKDLGVQAPDEKTVVITLEQPTPYFLNILCMANFSPIRMDVIEKEGSSFAMRPSNAVYNGPFVLSAWKKGRKIVLEKNEEYYNKDSIATQRVEIIIVSSVEEAYELYKKGDIDFVEVADQSILSQEENYILDYDGSVEYIAFNFNNRFLQNKNLRLAIAHVLDREEILVKSGQKLNQIATRYILPDIKGIEASYGEEQRYTAFQTGSERSDALNYLASALHELGLKEASDIHLNLLVENTKTKKLEGEVIKKQLETVLGIKVDLRKSSKVKKVESEATGDFAMSLTTWYPDYADAFSYLEMWESSSIYNIGCYNNKFVDNKIREIREQPAKTKTRGRRIYEAEKLLCEDAAMVPIQFSKRVILRPESLGGLVTYYIGANYNYIHAYKK